MNNLKLKGQWSVVVFNTSATPQYEFHVPTRVCSSNNATTVFLNEEFYISGNSITYIDTILQPDSSTSTTSSTQNFPAFKITQPPKILDVNFILSSRNYSCRLIGEYMGLQFTPQTLFTVYLLAPLWLLFVILDIFSLYSIITWFLFLNIFCITLLPSLLRWNTFLNSSKTRWFLSKTKLDRLERWKIYSFFQHIHHFEVLPIASYQVPRLGENDFKFAKFDLEIIFLNFNDMKKGEYSYKVVATDISFRTLSTLGFSDTVIGNCGHDYVFAFHFNVDTLPFIEINPWMCLECTLLNQVGQQIWGIRENFRFPPNQPQLHASLFANVPHINPTNVAAAAASTNNAADATTMLVRGSGLSRGDGVEEEDEEEDEGEDEEIAGDEEEEDSSDEPESIMSPQTPQQTQQQNQNTNTQPVPNVTSAPPLSETGHSYWVCVDQVKGMCLICSYDYEIIPNQGTSVSSHNKRRKAKITSVTFVACHKCYSQWQKSLLSASNLS
eukprot:TRINITY_DN15866_c0_g1_i1.p1 TRINITY_DN15866_c0_g1~~TRINITY_DN15866_c0_g1_i1.p1  ORF type:complete len:532 (+),score=55.85 TRINITY_DN15866_c0_g1_i1:107-1597(+)